MTNKRIMASIDPNKKSARDALPDYNQIKALIRKINSAVKN